jgi:hypothetical protein
MDKLIPLLALIVTASISVSGPAMAEWRFAGPLSSSFVTGPDAAVVLVAGKGSGGTTGGMGGSTGGGGMGGSTGGGGMGGSTGGGGMGGGSTGGGGMGGSTGGGGMGGGSTGGGGMGGGMGGSTGGGMGGSGGMTGFGGMTGAAGGSVGTTGNPPGNSVQPAYYTYECVTPGGQCSFAAPAALRSTSLRAGARCACAVGQPEGQIR